MKKILLILGCLMALVASALAEDVTYTSPAISNEKLSTASEFTLKWGDVTWTISHTSYSDQRHAQRNGTTSLVFGAAKNNKQFKNVTFSASIPFAGKTIKSASVKAYTKAAGATVSLKIGDAVVGEAQNIATSSTEYTWNDINAVCPENGKFSISFDAPTTTPTTLNVVAISVTYGDAVNPNQPATPTISCTDNMVAITAEEGAEIYYTTDGITDPTAQSTPYTSPFGITEDTTVKAIAIKDGESSNVATFNAVYFPTFNGYAEMVAAGVNTTGRVNGPITAIYYNNKNLYTKDSQGNYMDIYGNLPSGLTIENGTTFSYVEGTYIVYEVSGLPELTDYTLGEVSDGAAVQPEVKSVAAGITAADASAYVKYSNVEIADINGKEFAIKDGDNTIGGYDTFSYSGLAAKTNVDITGFVVMRDKTPRIAPILIEATTETGISSIEAENGEAIYFNLQGVRVQNPEKGIFIRVQNGKAVKITK